MFEANGLVQGAEINRVDDLLPWQYALRLAELARFRYAHGLTRASMRRLAAVLLGFIAEILTTQLRLVPFFEDQRRYRPLLGEGDVAPVTFLGRHCPFSLQGGCRSDRVGAPPLRGLVAHRVIAMLQRNDSFHRQRTSSAWEE